MVGAVPVGAGVPPDSTIVCMATHCGRIRRLRARNNIFGAVSIIFCGWLTENGTGFFCLLLKTGLKRQVLHIDFVIWFEFLSFIKSFLFICIFYLMQYCLIFAVCNFIPIRRVCRRDVFPVLGKCFCQFVKSRMVAITQLFAIFYV